jgi:hypothetical protein
MSTPAPASPSGAAADRSSGLQWTPLGVVAWLTLLWIVVGVLGVVQVSISKEVDLSTATIFACMDWGPWILLSPLVVWFSLRAQVNGRNWLRMVPLHLVAGLVAVLLHEGINEGLLKMGVLPAPPMGHHRVEQGRKEPRPEPVGATQMDQQPDTEQGKVPSGKPPGPPPESSGPVRFVRVRLVAPIYFFLVAAVHAILYHRHSLERERRALEAEALLSEARLLALQTQLQPHFLFNTLNTVSSLVYSNPVAADEVICNLSSLLRQVLDYSGRNQVPLSEELGFVESYLKIQRIRFPDRLITEIQVENGLEGLPVPTLILQPLVENAIIHGLSPKTSVGSLSIRARREGDHCIISVCDSGKGGEKYPKNPDGSLQVAEHVGLHNTRGRLEALHGSQASFGLYPNSEGGICARISIPSPRA